MRLTLMGLKWPALLLCAIFLGKDLAAEPYRASTSPRSQKIISTRQAKKASASKLIGSFALKPTYQHNTDSFFFEDTAELGLKVSEQFSISYFQDFNLMLSETESATSGLVSKDGAGKLSFNKIAESEDKTLAFSDEVRIYAPTDDAKRAAGMMTALRNYFKLSRKLSPAVTIQAMEVPILHLYSEDGSVGDKGKKVANPIFENQIIFELNAKFSEGVALVLPIKYCVTKNRSYAQAENDGAWTYFMAAYPVFNFTLVPNVTLGVGYNTGNFVSDGDYGVTWNDGIAEGAFQLSLTLGL